MVEKITKLKIKGGKFEKDTPFEFFNDEKQRVTIVYGRNGSGKSTIAKGFKNFEKIDDDSINNVDQLKEKIKANLLDKDGNSINNDVKGKVVVFDEDYINKNIGFKDSGIETIILVGKQKKIEDIERKINDELDELSDENEKIKKELEKKRVDEKTIKKELEDKCKPWKTRKLRILENTGNNVTDAKMKEISSILNNKNQEELLVEYNKKLDEFNIVRKPSVHIDNVGKLNEISNYNQKVYDTVLSKHILESNEQVKEIYELTSNNLSKIRESKQIFDNDSICPYCFQEINDNYRNDMLQKINIILNDEINKYTQELLHLKIKYIEKEKYEYYYEIDSELVKSIILETQLYNDEAQRINSKIDDKIDEPFEVIDINVNEINEIIIQLNNNIKSLNEKITNIKEIDKNIKKVEEELLDLNDRIACFEIKDCYSRFCEIKETIADCEKNEEIVKNKIEECNAKLKQLRLEKGDVKIAVDKLNNYLSYILFSKDRITIGVKDNNLANQYIVKINGKNVSPRNVSTGERNIIALCYFFIDSMYGEKEDELYKKEKLYVIDDPVSSFDYDNRIGIMSFLRMQYDKILHGADNSRVLVLSHDIATVRDTYKCIKDIYNNKTDKHLKSFILQNDKLLKFEHNENLYCKLLKDVYDYASNDEATDSDQSIGNKMRRVIEAFSTFLYRKGIEELSTNESIIDGFDNSEFYKNSMYRLVLHGESHLEEEVKNIGGINYFFQFLDEKNKRETARQMLCLMHILNPLHIRFQLYERDENGDMNKAEEKINNKIKTIEKWENDFKLKNE